MPNCPSNISWTPTANLGYLISNGVGVNSRLEVVGITSGLGVAIYCNCSQVVIQEIDTFNFQWVLQNPATFVAPITIQTGNTPNVRFVVYPNGSIDIYNEINVVALTLPPATLVANSILEARWNYILNSYTVLINGGVVYSGIPEIGKNGGMLFFMNGVGTVVDRVSVSTTCCSPPIFNCPTNVGELDLITFTSDQPTDWSDGGAGGTFSNPNDSFVTTYLVPQGSGGSNIVITATSNCGVRPFRTCSMAVGLPSTRTLNPNVKVNQIDVLGTVYVDLVEPLSPCDLNSFFIKKIVGSGTIVLQPSAITPPIALIDGQALLPIYGDFASVEIFFDGANWWTLSKS